MSNICMGTLGISIHLYLENLPCLKMKTSCINDPPSLLDTFYGGLGA